MGKIIQHALNVDLVRRSRNVPCLWRRADRAPRPRDPR
jgi:hypothetical protein